MIRLSIAGVSGRMGKTILSLALEDRSFKIAGGLERADSSDLGRDVGELAGGKLLQVKVSKEISAVLKDADVLIDFTHAAVVPDTLKAVLKAGTAYVIGTTGLAPDLLQEIRKASQKVAIVQSPNMSIGVNLLFGLTELAGKVLDESYDAEIAEIHHRGKKDAPSGTAMKLLEILAAARRKNTEIPAIYGRKGDIGVRPPGQIGVLASRGGDVVGDHTVSFLGDGERIELTHRASSRDAFAKGALLAAKFAVKQKSGLFDMRQVLGMV